MTNAVAVNNPGQIAVPESLRASFKLHADQGMEEEMDLVPQLKIISEKSKGELLDGSKPEMGMLYHSGLKKAWPKLDVHIFKIISSWMPAWRLANQKLTKAEICSMFKTWEAATAKLTGGFEYNEIVGGVIHKTNEPFIFYVSGSKLSYASPSIWEFRSTVAPFTRSVETPIPMPSLTATITTMKVKTDYGDSFVPNFTLKRDTNGLPAIEITEADWDYFQNNFGLIERFIREKIERDGFKSKKELMEYYEPKPEPMVEGAEPENMSGTVQDAEPVQQAEPEQKAPTEEELKKGAKEELNADDIPF